MSRKTRSCFLFSRIPPADKSGHEDMVSLICRGLLSKKTSSALAAMSVSAAIALYRSAAVGMDFHLCLLKDEQMIPDTRANNK